MSENKTHDKRDSFLRLSDLIEEIDSERYGKPLVAALHLCNDLADELERLKEVSSASTPTLTCPRCGDEWRGQACVGDCPLWKMVEKRTHDIGEKPNG